MKVALIAPERPYLTDQKSLPPLGLSDKHKQRISLALLNYWENKKGYIKCVIKCVFCGKLFRISPNRLKDAKYCSINCKLKASYVSKICPVCGKTFSLPKHHKGRTYCSKSCAGVVTGIKAIRRRGENHPMKRIDIRHHLSQLAKKRIGILNPFYGKHHSNEVKKLISIKTKNRMADLVYRENILRKSFMARLARPNKKEVILGEILAPQGFGYVGDGILWIDGFNPDFINENTKTIIELYGCYFHYCKLCYPKSFKDKKATRRRQIDAFRMKCFHDKGYSTYIVWEHQINRLVNEYESLLDNAS